MCRRLPSRPGSILTPTAAALARAGELDSDADLDDDRAAAGEPVLRGFPLSAFISHAQ